MTNVVLKDVRKTIELALPSFPESKIVLYDGIRFSEMREIQKMKDDFERGLLLLQCLIKEWNFTDENGQVLEVNSKNLNQLPLKDLQVLMEKAREILEAGSKKNEKSSKD